MHTEIKSHSKGVRIVCWIF